MKKFALLSVIALMVTMTIVAQNVSVDLTKGTSRGITLSGTMTLTSSEHGGDYILPEQEYGIVSGLKIKMSNFKKMNENASNAICAINVYFTNDEGKEQKASMGFWSEGKKSIRFSSFKNGDKTININPSSIKRIGIGMSGNKQFDAIIELIPRDPQE